MSTIESLQYPIGKFEPKETYTPEDLHGYIQRIETLPARIEAAIKGLSKEQLDTPYRDGGWTLRQVVHHVPESHMNAFIRTKWTLTEDTPTIKAYNEKGWAEAPDKNLDISLSLNLLKALHVNWVYLLKNISSKDLPRQYLHPDTKKHVRLDTLMGMYAWHGDHHLAHITSLKQRKGW